MKIFPDQMKFFIIDLRQVAQALRLTDADRAAFYRKYDVAELGPYLRVTTRQAAELDALWLKQIEKN